MARAHCADALTTGETCAGIWFDRHQEWLARLRSEEKPPHGFYTHHRLALAPLPCWRHLPPLEVQRRIAMLVAEIEGEAAARHRAEGGWNLSARAPRVEASGVSRETLSQ
jgi:hypothetical protein